MEVRWKLIWRANLKVSSFNALPDLEMYFFYTWNRRSSSLSEIEELIVYETLKSLYLPPFKN